MSGRSVTGRKIIKRACDGCKVRKIKCSELPPCDGCVAAGIACTFKKPPCTRGPRKLRPKTIQEIAQRQQRQYGGNDGDSNILSPPSSSTPPPADTITSSTAVTATEPTSVTSVASLVLRLRVYRLRLFPVWPIVAVEEIMGSLQREEGDMETYALANAMGAATVAQLKLDCSHADKATGSSMEAECQRSRILNTARQEANLNMLRTAFFLHVYHENQEAGGIKSLLYLREAITLAQILNLHRESSYVALSPSEEQIRRRILWLLFVTERGVAMLHNFPVVLKPNTLFPSMDGDDGSHILPAFRKLINLFWIFDQSGAFDILQNSDMDIFNVTGIDTANRTSLDLLQQKLQEVPIDWESSNDVQRADICVTRQWMRTVLWRVSMNQGGNRGQLTSLSHPIQIAKEFLGVISKLPNTAIEAHGPSIEFKIYEIASAVTDAIANNDLAWSSSDHHILNQLQRILSSCRGGNKTLVSMLYAKIAHVHSRQQLLMEPSSRIEEIGEHWPGEMDRSIDGVFYTGAGGMGASTRYSPTPPGPDHNSDRDDRSVPQMEQINGLTMLDFAAIETQFPPPGQDLTWTTSMGDNLTSTLPGSPDLYEQLQNFDGSFNNLHSGGTLNRVLSESDILDDIAGDAFSNMLPGMSIFS